MEDTHPSIFWFPAGVVKGGSSGGVGSGWRQVRGRVYSRFHSRLMVELSSTGLHHAASLFLTLATVADPLDVVSHSFSFLCHVVK